MGDPVLDILGSWSWWQARIYAVFSFVGFFFGWHMLAANFLLPEQEFWCSPSSLGLDIGERSHTLTTSGNITQESVCSQNCSRWDFDRNTWTQTVVSQFHLVCNRDYLRSLSSSMFMLGIMLGSFLSGILSDRFGRKRMSVISAVGLLVFGCVTAVSNSIEVFIVLRLCVACCTISLFNCGFVYCMEMLTGRLATILGIGLMIPFSLASMSLSLVSWIFPKWQHLQLAISLPISIMVVTLLIPDLSPESPRWLLTKGRITEAYHILNKAAHFNGKQNKMEQPPPAPQIESVPEMKPKQSLVLDLVRNPGILRSTVVLCYLFFTNSFVYYGMTLNIGSFMPGNIHYNNIILGSLEILANIATIFAFLYFGRRKSVCVCMSVGGIALLLRAHMRTTTGDAAMAHIGKFAISGSFSMVYLYAVEIYPTEIRNAGLGFSSVWARVGGILAPFMGRELGKKDPTIPLYIFGLVSLLGSILVLILPETQGLTPADTLEEGEKFNLEQGGIIVCRDGVRRIIECRNTKVEQEIHLGESISK